MTINESNISFNPAVGKKWLHLAAGLMWSGVGVMLAGFASRWLKSMTWLPMSLTILAGAALAALIYLFGFSKVAKKNIRRINAYTKAKVCVFAFQAWKTYPLVALMISLGIYLRIYSPIPKPMLAIAYLGLGFSLFLSSLLYYRQLGLSQL
jgi:hypothetical protein